MTNKTCKNCEQLKEFSEFSKAPSNRDGYVSICKACVVIRNTLYWRTPKGRISHIINTQRLTSKVRGHAPPAYTVDELYEWAISQGLETLCAAWAAQGHPKDLAPSIDRLDVTKGYDFGNIRLVVWWVNNAAQYTDRKSCKVVTRQNREVNQYSLSGELIATYKSIAAAARATGAVRTNINCMCSGTNPAIKSVGGFIWKYADIREKEAA